MKLCALPLTALTACGGPTWYQDVEPIIEGRCQTCHTQEGVGPFALDSYEQASAMAPILAASVEARIMPPWSAAPERDYANDHSLTEAQIATIVEWAAADAPEGDPESPGERLPSLSPSLPRVDVSVGVPAPYEPDGAPDDYRCFVLDWPESATRFVTGFEPKPGNSALVHHIAAFLVRPDNLAGESAFEQVRAWDEASAGLGYPCFGGPGNSEVSEELRAPIQQLAQWVPGGGAFVFPEGSGIEVPAGSMIVLQVHYYDREEGSDQTSLDFMTESTVERRAAFAPWLNATWPLGNMTIPAGAETDVDHVADPREFWTLMTGGLDLDRGFAVHAAMMHMHTRGTGGGAWIERPNGETETILRLSDYDFDWQINYQLAQPARFEPGDLLGVECVFDNPGDVALNWGEGTDDEMCVANLYVTEL